MKDINYLINHDQNTGFLPRDVYPKINKGIQDFHDKRGFMPNLIAVSKTIFILIGMASASRIGSNNGKMMYAGIDLKGDEDLDINSAIIMHTSDITIDFHKIGKGWTWNEVDRGDHEILNRDFIIELNLID